MTPAPLVDSLTRWTVRRSSHAFRSRDPQPVRNLEMPVSRQDHGVPSLAAIITQKALVLDIT